jgi:hypothetical protein
MTFKKNFISGFFAIATILFLSACGSGGDSSKDTDSTAVQAVKTDSTQLVKIQKVFYSVPSPLQVTSILKASGAKFTSGLLSSSANATKFSTTFSKALNMGVYGTDLAYANIFGQAQAAINYMDAARKMGNELGLASIFNEEDLYTRFQKNLNNEDSLFSIIADLYGSSEDFLRENDKHNIAAAIIAGGWIEGMYLAVNQSDNGKNKDIVNRIGEQKLSLDNLLLLLGDHSSDPDFTSLTTDLKAIKTVYDGINIERTEKGFTTDEASQTTVINNETKVIISDTQVKEISDKVTALRTKITTP